MLLWLVVALSIIISLGIYAHYDGITHSEAIMLLISSILVFFLQLEFIYEKTTTDSYIVTGYVTSLIYRPAFHYSCGKDSTCHEPERWIIEQRPHLPIREVSLTRNHAHGIEYCKGECQIEYPSPYVDQYKHRSYYAILVNKEKLIRTKLRDHSSLWINYFNPVRVSDDVVYKDDSSNNVWYFQIEDYNIAHRLIPTNSQAEEKLEKINAEFSGQNISVGLVITEDTLYYEKIKNAWSNGKANDFIIIAHVSDNKIKNVNVVSWYNYLLRENVSLALLNLGNSDVNLMLDTIKKTLQQGPAFTEMNMSNYGFINVKIPEDYYWRILIFQFLFVAYTLTLLCFNPNTKTHKVTWNEMCHMWGEDFYPPELSWYLHHLSPHGMFLHLGVPTIAVRALWSF